MYEIGYAIIAFVALLLISGVLVVFHKKKKLHFAVSSFALLGIAAAALYAVFTQEAYPLLGVLIVYPFSMLFVFLFSFTLLLINILSYDKSHDYASFSMLFSFVVTGALVVAMSNSLVGIVLGIELTVLPTAFMIMLNGRAYIEAAVKLFVLSAISVSMLVFAIVLIFPYNTTLSLQAFSPHPGLTGNYLVLLALLLFIAGLAFDTAMFPFNMWVPDVYQGSPSNITAMLAGVNKKVAFVAILEVLFVLMLPLSSTYSMLIQLLAVMTMFFGNLVALVQTDVKRLFAYSSIAQAGYIAIGIASASEFGLQSSIFYIFAHSFMIIGAFSIVLWLESKKITSIQDYKGLYQRNGFASIALTIFMLSMIGIPPFIGFIGKFLLFSSAISANLVWLAVLGILNSLISVYYYTKVMTAIFSNSEKEKMVMGAAIGAVVIICLVVIVAIGIFPEPLIAAASTASNSLLAI
jgi:NADH-quinone oxidoreductase subunit N